MSTLPVAECKVQSSYASKTCCTGLLCENIYEDCLHNYAAYLHFKS